MSEYKACLINCTGCGHQQKVNMWSSVNVSLDRDLKKKLLNRELTEFNCKKCKARICLQHSMLYHDMDNRTAIWLLYPRDENEASHIAMKEFTRILVHCDINS